LKTNDEVHLARQDVSDDVLAGQRCGVSMRFLPKSRASRDQAPGPINARVAPNVADIM